jgi:hypothetical protein
MAGPEFSGIMTGDWLRLLVWAERATVVPEC